MFSQRRGARAPGFAIWLLLGQMYRVGFDRIPPVTLLTILSQVAIHLRHVIELRRWLALPMSIGEVCVSALHVWYREDWARLAYAAVYHADDMHLYFNMTSMLWKGLRLERRLGSVRFGVMIAAFSVLTNALLVLLGMLCDHVTHDGSYITQCAVGFSGVLFALKVVANHMDPPGIEYVMGMFPVPTKFVCWVELLLIHVMVPNASFIGHLAGILVGLLYVSGPLKFLFDCMFEGQAIIHQQQPSYHYAAGRTGYGDSSAGRRPTATASAPPPTSRQYMYTDGLDEDEQLARAVDESLRNVPYGGTSNGMPQPTSSERRPYNQLYPNLATDFDDVRRRRLERFS